MDIKIFETLLYSQRYLKISQKCYLWSGEIKKTHSNFLDRAISVKFFCASFKLFFWTCCRCKY